MIAQIAQRHAKMELVPKWLQGVLAPENCRFSPQDGKPWTVAHSCEIIHSHGLLTHLCTYCLAAKEYYVNAGDKPAALGTLAVA